MQIYNSSLIDSYKDMKKVLNKLLELEKKESTKWSRTYNSMLNEWIIHNIICDLNLLKQRSMSVDFNNNDEDLYSNILLSFINGYFNDDIHQLEREIFLSKTK